MSEPVTNVLCLGSNTAERLKIISDTLVRLSEICDIVDKSHTYEAEDESGLGNPYINIVISIATKLTLNELSLKLKDLERLHGRTDRSKACGVMPLDADIIVWNNEIVDPYQFSRDYFKIGYSDLTKV